MSENTTENTVDKLKAFRDFRKVLEEYADKTSTDKEQTVYGYYQMHSNDPENPLSQQEKYMKELRESLDKFEAYLTKFAEKHPELPLDIQARYLDHHADNPQEHHLPFQLKIEAKLSKKPEKLADISVLTYDYRGLPDISIRFGNREIYNDRFGKAYEQAQTKKICRQSSFRIAQKLQTKKDREILNASPQPKIKYKAQTLVNKIASFFSKKQNDDK